MKLCSYSMDTVYTSSTVPLVVKVVLFNLDSLIQGGYYFLRGAT